MTERQTIALLQLIIGRPAALNHWIPHFPSADSAQFSISASNNGLTEISRWAMRLKLITNEKP
ncbi:hypothetical protein [Bradyrhizobium canariense]|uniref:Uncharacterized protein n=1 Tax=Bradyrhizobium canariense TaxID=255045 RepID=A0A1H1UW47_9BRAD|nr:hypothetical protein [Bradyrhizobium canariense]SDS76336.1 hypothetical protein SAMN05444158_3116 [Bradyrhizobium canariense]